MVDESAGRAQSYVEDCRVLQVECTACPVRHWGTRILDYGAAGIVI